MITPDASQPDAVQSAAASGRQARPGNGHTAPADESAAAISSLTGLSYITVCPAAIRGSEPLNFTLYRKSADGQVSPFKPAGSTLSDAERAQWIAADAPAAELPKKTDDPAGHAAW